MTTEENQILILCDICGWGCRTR